MAMLNNQMVILTKAIYRWFSQLQTSIYSGFPMAMSNNQMVDQMNQWWGALQSFWDVLWFFQSSACSVVGNYGSPPGPGSRSAPRPPPWSSRASPRPSGCRSPRRRLGAAWSWRSTCSEIWPVKDGWWKFIGYGDIVQHIYIYIIYYIIYIYTDL